MNIEVEAASLASNLARDLGGRRTPAELKNYALIAVVTKTPFNRALVYLKDCEDGPDSAEGRLLLRAAERRFRKTQDAKTEYKDADEQEDGLMDLCFCGLTAPGHCNAPVPHWHHDTGEGHCNGTVAAS